jgi:hypothetical protein
MLRWLDQKATDSATIAAQVFGMATAAAKPKFDSVSRAALETAGDISETIAIKLLGMSKAARIATLRNMPYTRVAQLLIELEREGAVRSSAVNTPESGGDSPHHQH